MNQKRRGHKIEKILHVAHNFLLHGHTHTTTGIEMHVNVCTLYKQIEENFNVIPRIHETTIVANEEASTNTGVELNQ